MTLNWKLKIHTALLMVAVSNLSHAADFSVATRTTSDCPTDYLATSLTNVCQHRSATRDLIYMERPAVTCATGFARAMGVAGCIAQRSLVDVVGDVILLRENHSEFCPNGMQMENGSTLCLPRDSMLAREAGAVVRTSTRTQPLEELDAASIVSASESCSIGFLRPPAFPCIEANIIYNPQTVNRALGLNIATHTCTPSYFKPAGKDFCVPKRDLPVPHVGSSVLGVEIPVLPSKLGEEGWHLLVCPQGFEEIWPTLPSYPQAGRVDKLKVMRMCVPTTAL